MSRARWGALAVVLLAVIAAAVVTFRGEEKPSEGDRQAVAVREFVRVGNRMTPEEVRKSFGAPDEVFRNNPRALCWAYHSPYKIRMCWGPKRQAAWIGHNVPNARG